MCRTLVLIAGLLFGSVGRAAEFKDELITKTYDVADLLHKEGKTGFDSVHEITQQLVEYVNPKAWLLQPDGGNRLFVVNGTKLEIKANKEDHQEIHDLLNSLRGRNDLAIEVTTTFLSVDARWFEKEARPHLDRKLPCAISDKHLSLLRKNAEVVQSGRFRLANGRKGPIGSISQSFAHIKPEPGENGQPVYGAEHVGVAYQLKATITADRRAFRLDMDEIVRELAKPKEKELTPRVGENKSNATLEEYDGVSFVHISPYTPQLLKDKGRVLIVVVEPVIWIEAEEKERRGKKDDG